MVKYKLKKLIEGWRIDKKYQGKMMVAIPRVSGPLEINFDDEVMYINDWKDRLEERVFQDKYGRELHYTLGYFIWNPSEQLTLLT
jgi:hypothetical protein